MEAEMIQDSFCILQGAGLVGADADHLFPKRLIGEERVKLDHAVYIGERDAQRPGYLGGDIFGEPAINSLGRMQGW